MGILKEIGRLAGNILELIVYSIAALIGAAIWAIGFFIDLMTDIISWINDKLEDLLNDGATEVNVVSGTLLADYIRKAKQEGNYSSIPLSEVNTLKNSVINVAMNNSGNIIDDQMIRSEGGLSNTAKGQFNGKTLFTVKLQ